MAKCNKWLNTSYPSCKFPPGEKESVNSHHIKENYYIENVRTRELSVGNCPINHWSGLKASQLICPLCYTLYRNRENPWWSNNQGGNMIIGSHRNQSYHRILPNGFDNCRGIPDKEWHDPTSQINHGWLRERFQFLTLEA